MAVGLLGIGVVGASASLISGFVPDSTFELLVVSLLFEEKEAVWKLDFSPDIHSLELGVHPPLGLWRPLVSGWGGVRFPGKEKGVWPPYSFVLVLERKVWGAG